MKERNRGNADITENDENRKQDDSPLVSLEDVYTSRDVLSLFVSNRERNKLKNIITNEIKIIEDEVKLIDLLRGAETSGIDEKVLSDLRQRFGFSKKMGFNPQVPYDFHFVSSEQKLYNLSLFVKIQKTLQTTFDYNEF